MEKRPLGKTGLHIAPLVLGGNVFGWTADEETSFRILDAFVDAGFNAIDTADVYTAWVPGHVGGESERVIGRWLSQRPGMRDRVVIFTKVGLGLDGSPRRGGLSKQWIHESIGASLSRLGTDRVDVYFSHCPDEASETAETLSAYGDLMASGKIRAFGASNMNAEHLAEAARVAGENGLPTYGVLQPEYNLVTRNAYEGDLRAYSLSHGLGVVPFYGLAAGFLTGKYRTEADFGKSIRGSRMARYLTPRGLAVLEVLDDIAARHSATPAQVSLAWLMARDGVTAPIASVSRPEQLDSLVGAISLRLDRLDLDALDIRDE